MKTMLTLAIAVLVLLMVGKRFAPDALQQLQPQPVDGRWASAMARRVQQDLKSDAARASRRQAVEQCMGAAGMALPPAQYDAKVTLCEARLAAAAAEPSAGPVAPGPAIAGAGALEPASAAPENPPFPSVAAEAAE